MENKRVLLIESGRFIGGIIHNLFSSHEKLTIIESRPEDGRELIRAVKEAKPAIVVLDDTLQMEYLNYLLWYMRNVSDIRIVVVNTSLNQVEIYHKQQVAVRQSADLFEAL